MSNKKLYGSLALVFLACAVFMGFGSSLSPQQLQPSTPFTASLPGAIESSPYEVLHFMAADTLFIICYITLLIAVYSQVVSRGRHLAQVALIMGLSAGLFDLLENSLFIGYAQTVISQRSVPDMDNSFIYIVANMKWMTIYVSMFINAVLWFKDLILNKLIGIFMIASPAIGILSIAVPELLIYRPYPFIGTFILLAIYFWRSPATNP